MKYKKSAIMQMFYGENGNGNNLKSPLGAYELLDTLDTTYKLLCEKLQPQTELWEVFTKYKHNLEELQILELDHHYSEGFKFGLLIGVEAGESKFDN